MSDLIEQRPLLRREAIPDDAVFVVRGGRDTPAKLRQHAERTARAWSLDGSPLYGISAFAVLDGTLNELLSSRFSTFRTVHLTSAGAVRAEFELLPTGRRPHFTIRLAATDIGRLLAVLGEPRENEWHGKPMSRREEEG